MKISKRLCVVGFLILFSSQLWAQTWLQYKTSSQANRMHGGSSQFIRPETTVPSGLALPEGIASENILVFKWATQMDPKGFRWLVLGKKSRSGLCNLLWLDADGSARLTDKPASGAQSDQYRSQFTLIPLTFTGEDGPITYHMNVEFYSYDERSTYLYVYSGCWYEGDISIDGKKLHCVLVDQNANGCFSDAAADYNGDILKIGSDSRVYHVGKYLEFDNKLYYLSIAKDGAYLEVNPAPEVTYRTVQVPGGVHSVIVYGVNGVYDRTVDNGSIQLPEGDYRVRQWLLNHKDDKGATWQLRATSYSRPQAIAAREQASELKIDTSVFSRVTVSARGTEMQFNQSMSGRNDENIYLTKNGSRIPAPKIHIYNKTGEYDRTFSLEYG